MSSPGFQAASPETLPQPDLCQRIQVWPQWETPGGRGSGEFWKSGVDTPSVTMQILIEEDRVALYSHEGLSQTLNPKFKTLISSCQLDVTAWIFRDTSSQHFPSLPLRTSNHTYSFFQCFFFLSPNLETWRSLLILPSPSLCSPFFSRFWALLWE